MTVTDFYLYFPSEEAARAAAAEAESDTGSVDVRLGADDVNWLTQVRKDIDRASLDENERSFEGLARRHGGEYDGFEADV